MLIYNAKEDKRYVLDYMGTSPYQATLDAYSEPGSNEGRYPGRHDSRCLWRLA